MAQIKINIRSRTKEKPYILLKQVQIRRRSSGPIWVPRAVASLSLPGGQERMISSIFPHFPVASLIFPQILFIFFLILVFRVGPWLRHCGFP